MIPSSSLLLFCGTKSRPLHSLCTSCYWIQYCDCYERNSSAAWVTASVHRLHGTPARSHPLIPTHARQTSAVGDQCVPCPCPSKLLALVPGHVGTACLCADGCGRVDGRALWLAVLPGVLMLLIMALWSGSGWNLSSCDNASHFGTSRRLLVGMSPRQRRSLLRRSSSMAARPSRLERVPASTWARGRWAAGPWRKPKQLLDLRSNGRLARGASRTNSLDPRSDGQLARGASRINSVDLRSNGLLARGASRTTAWT